MDGAWCGAAAYCSGSKLQDDRLGRDFRLYGKVDLVHSELLLAGGGTRKRWLDRGYSGMKWKWSRSERTHSWPEKSS